MRPAPLAALLATARRLAGVPITYTRGATTATLTALRGSRRSDTIEQDDQPVAVQPTDWLVGREDLTAAGLAPPAVGDTIAYTAPNGQLQKWTVAQGDDGRPWYFSDPGATQYRIHTTRSQ
jgi:hypothetical protein